MTFEQLEIEDTFKSIGKITGNLSQYTWTKIEGLTGRDGVFYNARTLVAGKLKIAHYGSFHNDDEVEKQ